LGAGIGAGIYKTFNEAFSQFKPIKKIEPHNTQLYDTIYISWKKLLDDYLAE